MKNQHTNLRVSLTLKHRTARECPKTDRPGEVYLSHRDFPPPFPLSSHARLDDLGVFYSLARTRKFESCVRGFEALELLRTDHTT